METFILLWFLFVVAAVAWFLISALRPLLGKEKSDDLQKLAETVRTMSSKAASSASAARAEYEPTLQSGLSSAHAFLAPYFSFSGRIARKQYVLTQVFVSFGLGLLWAVADLLSNSRSSASVGVGILLFVVSLAISCWLAWAASVKRTRDTGVTVWWALTLLVPPLNVAALGFLLLVPSDEFAGRGL